MPIKTVLGVQFEVITKVLRKNKDIQTKEKNVASKRIKYATKVFSPSPSTLGEQEKAGRTGMTPTGDSNSVTSKYFSLCTTPFDFTNLKN